MLSDLLDHIWFVLHHLYNRQWDLTKKRKFQLRGLVFLQSSAFGGTLGFHIPNLHLTVRGIFDWEYYRAFKFQDQIEFMGPMVCDTNIGLCQRSRAMVDSTHLTSWSTQIALAVVF